jgi:hypothetical protein
MSYSPINSLRKAVKDEKVTKVTKKIADVRFLSPLHLEIPEANHP